MINVGRSKTYLDKFFTEKNLRKNYREKNNLDLLFFALEMATMVKPDERAVMTYVSCYYHALKGAQKVCEPNMIAT